MSGIDHSTMDHGGMDHSMPGMHDMCSMDMLFTWDWKNRCIVFKWWHVRTAVDFVFSMFGLIVISMGYEFLKHWVNKWEGSYVTTLCGSVTTSNSEMIRQYKWKSAILYAIQIGYSFMLMLVFMSYSGWFMLSVIIGAAIGKFIWGMNDPKLTDLRSMACH